MFVSLVPAAVDHFGKIRIRGSALDETSPLLERSRGVIEEGDVGGTKSFVDDEIVELIVLFGSGRC